MQISTTGASRLRCDVLKEALSASEPVILHQQGGHEPLVDFAKSVACGLGSQPRRIESRFLYDTRGSALFEMITRQPEYYLTRIEASILAEAAPRLRSITGPVSILELGSGSSEKTGFLIDAWLARDGVATYIPVDVSESALRQACSWIAVRSPSIQVAGIHGQYEQAISWLNQASPAMAVFLGSTIGNMDETEMSRFLRLISSAMGRDDFFLIGFDLVKDSKVIDAAYNDAAGVTARFTKNLFVRMNRELGCEIESSTIEHHAKYCEEQERVKIHARFTRSHKIDIMPLGTSFFVGSGEVIRTEISRKFRLGTLIPLLMSHGLKTVEVFTDSREWFALLLLRKAGEGPWASKGSA
ncbi:L-histidine N(alpha)-methyltransferase [Geobacter sp. DSM 9736]|uniref:L-histidine N(alpha)-methyltransferase n=1 Tax=Geobacter sp. DSM 9736 TaxID=1277350 RepID=UPI000B60452C|nr:L-histidine N(alpha)-methyltransferase [Geobacter sp. DSM 9736]SNB45868.1 L-histidine Nalpha-methyltransferase [Geobacter sp. DSM 9736]